jgi:hypothetical protein
VTVESAKVAAGRAVMNGLSPAHQPYVGQSDHEHEARKRLASVEARDSTTASGSLDGMLGASTGSTPGFIAELFALACRSRAVVASALPQLPIPDGSTTIRTARLTAGAGAGVQATQNTAATEADPTTAIVESPIATIASLVDFSYQSLDWSPPGGRFDELMAAEMGRALGGTLESQLFSGTGTNGQMKGFFATGGTTTVTVTANPVTFPTFWAAALDARRQHAVAFGAPPDMLAWHPRRSAWVDYAGTLAAPLRWGIDQRLESDEFPTTRWTGSTNDAVLMLSTEEMALHSAPVQFVLAFDQAGSGVGTARLVAHQYAGLHIRQPLAVSHVAGTLSAPSF